LSRRNYRLELTIVEGVFNRLGYKSEIPHKRRRFRLVIVLLHRYEIVVFVVHKRENVFGRPRKCVVCSDIQKHRSAISDMTFDRHCYGCSSQ